MSFIEVCAGAGGLSTGFIQAGLKPILLNEIDKTFCKTLETNHNGVTIIQKNMQDLSLIEYKGKVDILAGGVPCQAFSIAGERKGLEDPRGKLMLDFNRLVNECMPKVLLIENVKGLLNHNGGETIKSIIELFENECKYKISYKLLNANDYEVPQKRERVVIIGVRSDIKGSFVFPEKQNKKLLLKDVLMDVPISIGVIYSEAKRKIMELVPEGGCWIHLPDDIKRTYMGNSLEAGGGKRGMARRLSMNEACLTLTTSPCQKQTERCHPIETRPLNVREYARIQTFPDDYIFHGGMMMQYKQIGNAVPVRLAYFIGCQLKSLLSLIH